MTLSSTPVSALLFSDGASQGNPGPSGWGAILLHNGHVQELGAREDRSTNNKMELLAVIEGLELARKLGVQRIEVRTDSKFVIDGATKWTRGWQSRGWLNQNGDPVSHRELWERMIELVAALRPSFTLVRGHSGVVGNERCDQIATAFASNSPITLYEGPESAYPFNVSSTETFEVVYLSLISGKLERHRTWTECEARVRGKTGARYKKVTSPSQEAEILTQWGVSASEA